jgi:hypothetical protein
MSWYAIPGGESLHPDSRVGRRAPSFALSGGTHEPSLGVVGASGLGIHSLVSIVVSALGAKTSYTSSRPRSCDTTT